jgi:UDPglucose--hexose-1-phosphate uridylyltransferase
MVIIAPDRQKNAEQLRRQKPRDWSKLPEGVVSGKDCPFCPGNEAKTPPEVMAYRKTGSKADESGWWVRTVPNLKSAVDPNLPSEILEVTEKGPYSVIPAFGYHYVIVEMSEHDGSLATTSPEQVREVLSMWRDLTMRVGSERNIKYCFIFENRGPLAGASQMHPHSQLIALPMIPSRVRNELGGSQRYWENNRKCFYCVEIEWELRMEERIVAQTDNFVAWSLFTARTPYQVIISPKDHQSYFANISTHPQPNDPLTEFSVLLQNVLSRLNKVLDDPDYSLYLHTAPCDRPQVDHYHWHLQIEPVTEAILAGFEKGSGVFINPRSPENAAKDLRENILK